MDQHSLQDIQSLFGRINQAIWLVTTASEDRTSGLTATWIHQASIDAENPTVLIGLAPNHYTCEVLQQSGACMLHLLHVGQHGLACQFARPSSRTHDKFAGLATEQHFIRLRKGNRADASEVQIPWIPDCHSAIACQTLGSFDAGDRVYFLSEITSVLKSSPEAFLRESDFFASCTGEQLRELKADLQRDVEIQRPLLSRWRDQLPE